MPRIRRSSPVAHERQLRRARYRYNPVANQGDVASATRPHRTMPSIAIQMTVAFCALWPSLADAQVSCADWNTAKFFKKATAVAGCAITGRESHPLGSVERFQINSSSFPGFRLALGQSSTPNNRPDTCACTAHGKATDESMNAVI